MSSPHSSSEDEDYVPELDADFHASDSDEAIDNTPETAITRTVNPQANEAWNDLHKDSTISKEAINKAEKFLQSQKPTDTKKKKKSLVEFQMPVLGLDTRKRRREILEAHHEKRVDHVVEFAGAKYKVQRNAEKRETDLDKVLAGLDGPKKLSTMEKTALDWDQYKEANQFTDELNQSIKAGYLEKQDFLQRMDQRQFELEKRERDRQRRLQQTNERK